MNCLIFVFFSAAILPGLHFGAGTRTIPWWSCYQGARTEAQKRHQSTHTNRQTDGQTDAQTHRQTQQKNSQGDINIAVSRLMQEKNFKCFFFKYKNIIYEKNMLKKESCAFMKINLL